jgi:hypothetical protein
LTKDDIELLYQFDRWANNPMVQACSALSKDQFTQDLAGSFCSVRDTLAHIIAGEWGWLQYWKELSPNAVFLWEMMACRKVLFDPNPFPDGPDKKKKTPVLPPLTNLVAAATRRKCGHSGVPA